MTITCQTPDQAQRDPGVDDATWTRLQADKAAAEAAEKDAAAELRQRNIAQQNALNELRAAEAAARKLAQKKAANDNAADEELMRQREAARIRELEAKAARESRLGCTEEEEVRRRREEAQAQRKLQQMGMCVAGFHWIKQSDGYRCAGGSHFVSNAQLDI